ncbi:MAG: NUDIX hydrolase [Sandaracinus sp.]|nr:NUDIX hydrolase [Sandaracinus sp.]
MGEILYRDARVALEVLELEGRDGTTKRRAVLRHPGAVVILPLLDDGRVVLIENRRPTLGLTLLELPAGTLEGEAPLIEQAARELREETGYVAGTLAPLTTFYASPGICDERMHAFVARGLTPGPQALDPTEDIAVKVVAWAEAMDAIREGRLVDGKSLAVMLFWDRFGA